MKTRSLFLFSHLAIGCYFLPLMLIMPLSGALHIWGVAEDQEKTEAFRVEAIVPATDQESFFREQFKKQSIDFDFEYIKSSKSDFIFRPTSRTHYVATQEGSQLIFTKVTPNLNRRLMELHKGHGPQLMRRLEMIFGIALIFVALSGVWLAVSSKGYRKVTLISFSVGLVTILVCLI